jgi:methyl-accepting chemotaxis protein
MNPSEPQFWMMVSSIVIAISFVVIAITVIFIAMLVRRAVQTVHRVEESVEPIIEKVNLISIQGREMAEQFTAVSGHLSTAAKNLSESTGLIREEVAELKQLVGETAVVAKDKVALVSRTIDKTQMQVTSTTDFIQERIVEPAREVAAVMAGLRKGLEVLLAPSPKPIDRVYADDELFIG